MSDEWYRGDAWDEDAQAVFEKKIARARNQKAYYLWMKARAIAPAYPDDSDSLFQRSIDCKDAFETGRAQNAWAAARSERGDVGGTLDSLAASARNRKNAPELVSTAHWDFTFVVGANRRRERYDEALKLLGPRLLVPADAFAAQAGLAFIDYDRGKLRSARKHAIKALRRAVDHGEVVPGLPVAPIAPFPNPVYDRLLVIAGKWDEATLGPAPDVWPQDS